MLQQEAISPDKQKKKRLLTVDDVAEMLQLGSTTVRQLIHREGLPVITFGRVYRIDPGDLDNWITNRKASA